MSPGVLVLPGTCTRYCSLSCPEKQHLLGGDRSLQLVFFPVHLPSNSGFFIRIKPLLQERLKNSGKAVPLQGGASQGSRGDPWMASCKKARERSKKTPGVFVTSSEVSHRPCRAEWLQECPVGHLPNGRAGSGAAELPQSLLAVETAARAACGGKGPVLESLEILLHSAL